MRCKVSPVEYFDLEEVSSQLFLCQEEAVENGFCIFHVGYEEVCASWIIWIVRTVPLELDMLTCETGTCFLLEKVWTM
jgi:hypothetical protein